MTRINTNVSSLTAQNALANSQSQLQTALTRLSTGLRINSGADDPAGLIESQNLGSEITADNSAISNSNQANDLISTADSALSQVSTLLNTIRGLVSDAANTGALTSSQISADQLQVDSSLQAIDQISQTTEFQGSRLLDGSLDFQTTSAGTIGTKATGTFGASATGTAGAGSIGAAAAAPSGTISSGSTAISITAATGTTAANGLSVSVTTVGATTGAVASASYTTSSNTVSVSIVSGTTTAASVATLITGAGAGVTATLTGSGGTATTGTFSAAVSGGAVDTQISLTSATGSTTANGITVAYTTGSSTEAASASYNASANTLTVNIKTSSTTAADVATAINALSTSPVAAATTATGVVTTESFSDAVTGGTAPNQFTVSATNTGSTYNGLTVAVTSGAASSTTASYNTASNTITVTTATGGNTASDIATAISGITGSLFSSTAVGSGAGTVAAGTLSATTAGGSSANSISGLQINQANFGTASSLPVNVTVEKQATQAELVYSGGALASATTLQIGGSNGYQVFDFGSGATVSQISSAINNESDSTGVTASVSSGNLVLQSQDYGSSNFVSADALTGSFSTVNASNAVVSRATGTDVQASINGVQATGAGLQVSLDTSSLNLSFNVSSLYADNSTLSFSITGGGATFQLGPNVTSSQQVTLGIQGVSTATLGGADGTLYQLASGGSADLSTDPSTAANIVDEVINQVTSLQGRLGAFQSTTLQTNISSLTDAVSNLTSAQSDIQDADYATETAALTRAQVLVQAGTSVLSIANQEPQQVLSLLKAAGG